MKVSFEWREGKNGVFQPSFLYENRGISEFERETTMKIKQRA